jgi:hypothetical protein
MLETLVFKHVEFKVHSVTEARDFQWATAIVEILETRFLVGVRVARHNGC